VKVLRVGLFSLFSKCICKVPIIALAASAAWPLGAAASADSCRLNSARGEIQHVIYIQFDNTHFLRDNPNVPSDLEQMPHLLNFMKDHGTCSPMTIRS
jgi:hypothetical protein